jgi:seryl-tRNA synthetase
MVTKENINKLASTLSEITKTLHTATTLANDAVEEAGKLQESISALSGEKGKLLAEIEELQKEKAQLFDLLQKTKENLNIKIVQELEEELFKKIDNLKHAMNSEIELNRDKKQDKTAEKKEFPNTVKKPIKKPSDTTSAIVDQFKAHTSINDTVHKSDPTIAMRHPIRDIAKAIAISDRFLFIKELFDNNAALFAQTVNELNMMNNLEDAKKHIQTVVKNWDDTSEPAQLFLSIVQRRYL